MDIKVTTYHADGTTSESSFTMPPELEESLNRAREYWAELAAAGTPYWCGHKDRGVDHPRAEWKDDDDDPIHPKHGVMCLDCGGYIQEG